MRYSFVIPVYNRPDEVEELLESLTIQKFKDFEVIVVEDGSQIVCRHIVEKYTDRLDIKYYEKPNSGPGPTRNYGVQRASGDFVLILDSDVVLPEGYLTAVEAELEREDCDAFGGPDSAHPSFSPIQKAINYGMTSFFTTGGIRGGKKKMDKFYPRSFNMGVRRSTYEALNGFSEMRFGEDIDFSTRIFENGYRCRLFPEAWVWHKRRTDLRKFFRQVHNSGIARIHLTRRHPGTLKLVHLLPACFTIGVLLCLIGAVANLWLYSRELCDATFCLTPELPLASTPGINRHLLLSLIHLTPLLAYSLLIMIDATHREHSFGVGIRAIAAAFVQLTGYGTGFIIAAWRCYVMKAGEFQAFKKNFYN